MDLDAFLPDYDFSEKHDLFIPVPPETAYQALKQINFTDSLIVRLLLWLRGLSKKTKDNQKMFTLLSDKVSKEIVLGMIGKPWTPTGGRIPIFASEFQNFSQPGYAKMAWNFTFTPLNDGTLVSTITRIKCMDNKSRVKFRIYWFFIKPFSGLLRRQMLKLIKKHTESFIHHE